MWVFFVLFYVKLNKSLSTPLGGSVSLHNIKAEFQKAP